MPSYVIAKHGTRSQSLKSNSYSEISSQKNLTDYFKHSKQSIPSFSVIDLKYEDQIHQINLKNEQYKNQIKKITKFLEELKLEIHQLEDKRSSVQKQQKELMSELHQINKDILKLQMQKSKLNDQILKNQSLEQQNSTELKCFQTKFRIGEINSQIWIKQKNKQRVLSKIQQKQNDYDAISKEIMENENMQQQLHKSQREKIMKRIRYLNKVYQEQKYKYK